MDRRIMILLVYFFLQIQIKQLQAIQSIDVNPPVLGMSEMSINSNIDSRYARTTVVKKLENTENSAQNVTYSVIFPEEAFVTGFTLEIDGKNYSAHATGTPDNHNSQSNNKEEKEDSVTFTERDTSRITLNINVKPNSKLSFYLTYEQVLKRQDGLYEHVINLQNGQPIKNFNANIQIKENQDIISLESFALVCKKGECTETPLGSSASSKNEISIKPNLTNLPQVAELLKSHVSNNMSGHFVIKYDVKRESEGGQIIRNDGYCVHYFAPQRLSPLPKYIVFILDTSKSMQGQRLALLKDAMYNVLDELRDFDMFNIISFSSDIKVWNLNKTAINYIDSKAIRESGNVDYETYNFPTAFKVNKENIKSAKEIISFLVPKGVTNVYSALRIGLHLVEKTRKETKDVQPLLVFLTDGEPTNFLKKKDEIVTDITRHNIGLRESSIFTLAFGAETDFNFLEQLAKNNNGFAKQIYDTSDASKQLQEFYKTVSTPLLTNVTFQYGSSFTNLTRTEFPNYFGGSELIVSGKCDSNDFPKIVIEGWSNTKVTFEPVIIESAGTDVKRIWVNIEISQLFEEAKREEKNSTRRIEHLQKAHDLALQNSFATLLTSLVIPDIDNGIHYIHPQNHKKPNRAVYSPGFTPKPFISETEKKAASENQTSIRHSLLNQYLLLFLSILLIY